MAYFTLGSSGHMVIIMNSCTEIVPKEQRTQMRWGWGGGWGWTLAPGSPLTCDPGQATHLPESPLPHQQLKGMYSTPSKPPYCRSNNLIPFIKTTLSVQYFTFSSMPTKCSKMKQRQDLLWVKNLLTQSQCNLTLFNFSHALICDDIQK